MTSLARLASIFDRFVDFLLILAILLLGFSWLSICFDVFVRYFFGKSVVWLIEVTEYILLSICFLGTAWLLRKEGHVNVDILVVKLNPKNRALFAMVTSFLGTITCSVVAWYSLEVVWDHFRTGIRLITPLEPPRYTVMAVIPLGLILLVIQFVRRFYGYFRIWRPLSGQNMSQTENP